MMPRRRYASRPADVPSVATALGDSETSDAEVKANPRKRFATVYDAVAGRLSTRDDVPLYSQTNDSDAPVKEPRLTRHPTRNTTLAPEEALFRRKQAPLRWPHHDIYMAHERDLPDEGRDVLPPSDLLKAVHSFASHYYDALGDGGKREAHFVGGRNITEKSMDETALLAFGILLEEAGREVLGARGDMVFTEGEAIVPIEDEASAEDQAEGSGSEDGLEAKDIADLELSSGSKTASPGRRRKRRKMSREDD